MSDVAFDGFVPRDAEIIGIREHEAAVRADERARRARKFVTTAVPWAWAIGMTIVAAGALAVKWKEPVPYPRLAVAVVTNGVYEPPTLREDLPASRKAVLFDHTVREYIKARENYSYASMPANQRITLAMSAPQEAQHYEDILHDDKDPDNPLVKYGIGSTAGTATVEAIKVEPDKDTPNSVKALFIVRVEIPHQAVRHVRKYATMSFVEAPDKIPLEVQQVYDPAAVAFLHYNVGDLETGS